MTVTIDEISVPLMGAQYYQVWREEKEIKRKEERKKRKVGHFSLDFSSKAFLRSPFKNEAKYSCSIGRGCWLFFSQEGTKQKLNRRQRLLVRLYAQRI